MTPLFDKLLIEIHKQEEVTSSGIYIATTDEKKLEKAKVLAIGEDTQGKVQPGDTIVFKSYNADTIEIDQQEYSFIKEEDVLAIYATHTRLPDSETDSARSLGDMQGVQEAPSDQGGEDGSTGQ